VGWQQIHKFLLASKLNAAFGVDVLVGQCVGESCRDLELQCMQVMLTCDHPAAGPTAVS
jgi:hypothetical protein